jgi:gluconate:H+ symporter, GntP family
MTLSLSQLLIRLPAGVPIIVRLPAEYRVPAFFALLTASFAVGLSAGSVMIPHVNDADFWVMTGFSGLELNSGLKVGSVASLLMALVSLLMIVLLALVLP